MAVFVHSSVKISGVALKMCSWWKTRLFRSCGVKIMSFMIMPTETGIYNTAIQYLFQFGCNETFFKQIFCYRALQNPVLWDECSDRSRGGQGSDNTAGPGHEEDGAVRRQTTRWARQRERGHKACRWAAQWEEMCMLDQEAIQEPISAPLSSVLSTRHIPSFFLLSLSSLIACLFIFCSPKTNL